MRVKTNKSCCCCCCCRCQPEPSMILSRANVSEWVIVKRMKHKTSRLTLQFILPKGRMDLINTDPHIAACIVVVCLFCANWCWIVLFYLVISAWATHISPKQRKQCAMAMISSQEIPFDAFFVWFPLQAQWIEDFQLFPTLLIWKILLLFIRFIY